MILKEFCNKAIGLKSRISLGPSFFFWYKYDLRIVDHIQSFSSIAKMTNEKNNVILNNVLELAVEK